MTNSEKAREYAAEKFKVNPESKKWNITTTYMSACDWKDQQFKEYLENNRTNYPDFMNGTHDYAMGMKEGYVVAFNRIINELFKED